MASEDDRQPHDSPPYDPPGRYDWSYIDNLRQRATDWGTVNEPNVVRLLARLEAGALQRHGPRPQIDAIPGTDPAACWYCSKAGPHEESIGRDEHTGSPRVPLCHDCADLVFGPSCDQIWARIRERDGQPPIRRQA